MSHFLTVSINENGIITDEFIDSEIQTAAQDPFKFTDVFLYSHGWWNTASRASSEYNVFSIGFAKTLQEMVVAAGGVAPAIGADFSALGLALHWPSMISEDQDAVQNFLEAASFFTMEHRADDVGEHAAYALLRLMIEAREGRPPLRFNLIGHSFGCRVICSALQSLAQDPGTLAAATASKAQFRVALIQAACDAGSLAPGKLYGDVLSSIPNLRMLVTTSKNDSALGTWYPAAQRIAHLFSDPVPALGDAGPKGTAQPVTDQFDVLASPVHTPAGKLAVANLTPLHATRAATMKFGWGGQHSDINLPEIYELLVRFLY